MTFSELLEYCQVEALASKMSPTDESVWRGLCRKYSKMFHTPLAQVEQLEMAHVVLSVYEEQFGELDVEENLEDIMDMLYSLQDPNYDKEKRDNLKDFMKRALREEEERIAKGKPIHRAMAKENEVSLKKTPEVPPTPVIEKIPPSGGINLAYLASEESDEGNGEF